MLLSEISSSNGVEYEAQNLLGCTAEFLIDIQLRTWQYISEDSELHVIKFINPSQM
jgi:hypothetical protein